MRKAAPLGQRQIYGEGAPVIANTAAGGQVQQFSEVSTGLQGEAIGSD